MFKKLHLLVFKSYIGPLILTFFISEFVLMMHFLWLYISDLVGKGLEWTIIAELLLYASAGLVPLALPLAILLASIMTFGDMGEHFELSAMKSAGISLQKIMTPLIVLSVLISIGAFFFSNNVLPYTNLKTGSLLYDVTHQRPELNIKPGIFNKDIDGYSIKIKEKNPNTPMMYDFMIYDHTEKRGNVSVILADSGKMEITDDLKYMIITLYHGRSFEEMKEKGHRNKKRPAHNDKFERQRIIFELASSDLERTDEALFKHNYQMKNIQELALSQDSLQKFYNTKKKSFITGLNRSKYYKYARKVTNFADTAQLIKDSIIRQIEPEQLKVIYNLDSLYRSFDIRIKQKTLEAALEYANSSKKTVLSTQKDLYERRKNIQKHRIAWHEKFTLSFACLIFFFIGAPLGAIIRKGGFGLPFLVSIMFFLAYYVVTITGKKLAVDGGWEAWEGMWLSSLFTLPIGIFFTYKATTDSVIIDLGSLLTLIKRPFKVYNIEYKDPDLIFYKDIEKLDDTSIIIRITNLIEQSNPILKQLKVKTSGHNKIYASLLAKESSNLKSYIINYNSLSDILSVQYRNINYIRTNIEKLPVVEYEKYEPTQKKRLANYILLTILYFPIGMLVLYRSYLKLSVLNKKLDQINYRLRIIKDEIEFKGSKRKQHELKISEDIAIESKYPIPDTREKMLDFIDTLKVDSIESVNFLNNNLNSFNNFLRFVLTKDVNRLDSFFQYYSVFQTSHIRKFDNNPEIKKLAEELPVINFNKKTKLNIFINYLILSIIPLAAIVFYILYLKINLKQVVKIDKINKIIENIREEIKKDKTKELGSDLNSLFTSLSEKSVDNISKQEIQNALLNIQTESSVHYEYLQKQTSSFFGFSKLLLSNDINELKPLFDLINRTAYLTKTKFKDHKDIIDDIKDYYILDFEVYKMTRLKIISNYLLLGFIIAPVGIIVYYLSKQKVKKLTNSLFLIEKTSNKILVKYFQ